MNKKKLFLTFALIALIACAAVMLFAGCEMISDPAEPDDMGIADMNGGDRLLTGLQVAAIGLLVVFVVLIVLIILIKGLKMLLEKLEQASAGRGKDRAARKAEAKARKAAEKQAKIDAARARVEAAQKKDAPAPVASETDEEEEIAAVMAAIYAYYDAMPAYERSNLKFRVRSIKEIK